MLSRLLQPAVAAQPHVHVCLRLQEPENQHQVPRVSPYRLAAHLTSAFAIYATLVWTTLDLMRPSPILSTVADKAVQAAHAAVAAAGRQQAAAAKVLRSRVLPLSVLVGITAISGMQGSQDAVYKTTVCCAAACCSLASCFLLIT